MGRSPSPDSRRSSNSKNDHHHSTDKNRTNTDRHRDSNRDRERDRIHSRDFKNDTKKHRSTSRERERERDRERARDRDRERDRNRERDRDRDGDRDRDRDRNRDKERYQNRDRERDRNRDRERDQHRDREQDREKDQHRERDHNHKRPRDAPQNPKPTPNSPHQQIKRHSPESEPSPKRTKTEPVSPPNPIHTAIKQQSPQAKAEDPESDHDGPVYDDRDGGAADVVVTNGDSAQQKLQPNFETSGALAAETNTVNGVVVQYTEPPDTAKPTKNWRLYVFKGETALQTMHIHRQNSYMFGRERRIVDVPTDHPSCSKQHAVLQFRCVKKRSAKRAQVLPYLVDLSSTNGTFLNGSKLEPCKFVELMEKDVIKFGTSTREYVLLHDQSE